MPNRLASATSPYLRQHADNPVAWQPWDADALAQAQREQKPILLSIGYAACHWCHVMAHESFEDAQIARLMNRDFVNIKVDREERPDLDRVYQSAHSLLTRSDGGWPLTMFLTPDGVPFYGGTYFPKTTAYGRPGMLDLLPRIAEAWRDQRDVIATHGAQLREVLQRFDAPEVATAPLDAAAIARGFSTLAATFDPVNGGLGGAPKFPCVPALEFAHARAERGDAEARNIVTVTLAQMAAGGIDDQLGGGFCRYSVDAQWTIPHFEKMLYDNALLLGLYAAHARAVPAAAVDATKVAERIAGFLERELKAPDGAYYASLDADSEHEEGRFYVWDRADVRRLLTPGEWDVAAPHWGLDGPPNFEGRAWHLRVVVPLVDVAQRVGVTPEAAATTLETARARLFAERSTRVRPGLDDKILTAWNALAIAAYARAARLLGRADWAPRAFAALDALRAHMWRDGRLAATRHGTVVALDAYLDDHAFLLAALLECLQLEFRPADHAWAVALADTLLDRFQDAAAGGFYFTARDHEALLVRQKSGFDGALPSGNGVAARALVTLAELAGEPRYRDAAARTVDFYATRIERAPEGYSTLLLAQTALLAPPPLVVLDGDPTEAAQWKAALVARFGERVHVVDVAAVAPADVPPALRKGPRPARGAVAHLCRDFTCLPPITALPALVAALDDNDSH
ncbi:MAG: thioredoxin domain-containing protein [Proteobacteria bacterium]|nr:thioredoxin domain-containing protein [Pseudomonadota bacterium]